MLFKRLRSGHGIGHKSDRFRRFVAEMIENGVPERKIYQAVVDNINLNCGRKLEEKALRDSLSKSEGK